VRRRVRVRRGAAAQFTCFTSTKVQILTLSTCSSTNSDTTYRAPMRPAAKLCAPTRQYSPPFGVKIRTFVLVKQVNSEYLCPDDTTCASMRALLSSTICLNFSLLSKLVLSSTSPITARLLLRQYLYSCTSNASQVSTVKHLGALGVGGLAAHENVAHHLLLRNGVGLAIPANVSTRQHTPAYVSMRQHAPPSEWCWPCHTWGHAVPQISAFVRLY
jgi:hypothetical protein